MKIDKIFITRPYLPPIKEYTKILSRAWDAKWLTNDGELHKEFEQELYKYLGVEYISLFNSATIALLIAQRALNFKGDIITTPFSFIATTHSIKWNALNPIFVDTDDQIGNLNPEKVEEAINDNTGGIMAVHNYGIPGDIEGMQLIAEKYSLPLIYDAAPAMGVKYKGETILQHGDMAVLSFHATKVFTTFEGGAIISRSAGMKEKIDRLKNFAILGPEKVSGLGINGKMNEAEAAMGLLQLRYIDKNISKRKEIYKLYTDSLKSIDGIRILDIPDVIEYNYAYFPVFFNEGISIRDRIHDKLKEKNIICRKYWYPLITDHDIYSKCKKHNLVNSRKLSDSTLCLPIYPDLTKSEQNYIIDILIEELT